MRSRLCTWIILLCLSACSRPALAQELHTIEHPLSNKTISIQKVEWQYSDTAMAVMATVTIKNKSATLAIKQIRLSFLAQDRNKVMLQHKGATIRRLVRNVDIQPGQEDTLVFRHAFRAGNIDQLIIREVIAEMDNGSLEILQP